MKEPTPALLPTVSELVAAHERIREHVHHTPVATSRFLNEACGAEIWFKCENLQRVGAFKIRGACNAIFSLSDSELERGVVAHSSGNHAQAVALAAAIRGTRATIVMPSNTSRVKLDAVREYGARVVLCEPTAEARETGTEEIRRETGAVLIHPFNDPKIISGQGTAARELLQDEPDLEAIIAPVGGGGLLSGTLLAARERGTAMQVYGAEPALADDARRSLESGQLQPPPKTSTIADGLRTSLGELTFAMIRSGAEGILTVDEDEIVAAMRMVWMRMKLLIEPSAAVPVAVLLKRPDELAGKRIGVILSGGNVDLDALPWTQGIGSAVGEAVNDRSDPR